MTEPVKGPPVREGDQTPTEQQKPPNVKSETRQKLQVRTPKLDPVSQKPIAMQDIIYTLKWDRFIEA